MKRENLDRAKSLCSRIDAIENKMERISEADHIIFVSASSMNLEINDEDMVTDCKTIVLQCLAERKKGIEQDLEGL